MSETLTLAPTPSLSPAFSRARTLSRIIAILFTLFFWFTVFMLAMVVVRAIVPLPNTGYGLELGTRIPLGDMTGWRFVGGAAAVILLLGPDAMILHHARKLFGCFAKGEVFAARPIAHLHWTGLWLIVSFFTGVAAVHILNVMGAANDGRPNGLVPTIIESKTIFFIGLATTIAAYVMEEARRIAADHAEIV
jgi:hypothetical protein